MFASAENKSYYRAKGVSVYVSTETNRLGPLFTVENGYVYSVHYSNHDERNPRPCKISIDTGEVEYLE